MNELSPQTAPLAPLQIVAKMIEAGSDPEQLGKMMDMAERFERNRAEKAYNEAMNLCQGEMPTIIKDADNNHTHSRYALLETVQKMIKPVYVKHGFSLEWSEGEPVNSMRQVICDVSHKEGHTKRRVGFYPFDGTGAKGGSVMNAIQGAVSSNTYAQKDMLRLIFNLTIAGDDDDGVGADPPGTISTEQANEIYSLLETRQIAKDKFLAWIGAKSVPAMTIPQFDKAVATYKKVKK